MATTLQGGPIDVSLSRDEFGYRTFRVTHLVLGEDGDGPLTALATPGLPAVGAAWAFGSEGDVWAWCRPEAEVKPYAEREGRWWSVEQTFSSRPPQRDPGQPPGDPLLEPPKVSVTFSKTTEEAFADRFGRSITNSAWEQFRGKQVEFDSGMVLVRIEQNLPTRGLAELVLAYQTVNAFPLWGMPRRTVKLDNASVSEANYYTVPGPPPAAAVYYKRTLEFACAASGWDRDLLDEATKVLYGRVRSAVLAGSGSGSGSGTGAGGIPDPQMWELLPVDALGTMPDPYHPFHFMKAVDRAGNPIRVVLNGAGMPAGAVAALKSQYISVVESSTGRPLSDGTSWVPMRAPPADLTNDVNLWDRNVRYRRGDLVIDDNDFRYVALQNNYGMPSGPQGPQWKFIPAFVNRGVYGAGVTYAVGDYVVGSTELAAGIVRVEKYNESDFGLLGIPLVI